MQSLATQNQNPLIDTATGRFEWFNYFVQIEADLGSKATKVQRILQTLDINLPDTAFIDQAPFERNSITAQLPGITAWDIDGCRPQNWHCWPGFGFCQLPGADTGGGHWPYRSGPGLLSDYRFRFAWFPHAGNAFNIAPLSSSNWFITLADYKAH